MDPFHSHLYGGKIKLTMTGAFVSMQILCSMIRDWWYSGLALLEKQQSLDGSPVILAMLLTAREFASMFSSLIVAALVLRRLRISDDGAREKQTSKATQLRSKLRVRPQCWCLLSA